MTLNTNEVKMVDLLFDYDCSVTEVAEIAEKMHVSARQIRNYVSNVNYYIGDAVEVKKGEIKLNLTPEQFTEKLRTIPVSHYRAMPKERQSFILDSYLFLNEKQYVVYEEQLHISRPTLKKDLQYLSAQLYAKGLSIELEDGRFIIRGTEKKIRHLMMERISFRINNIYPDISFGIINSPIEYAIQNVIEVMIKKRPIEKIHLTVTKIASSITQKYSDDFFKLIFIYLLVSLIRIDRGRYIITKNNELYLRNSSAIKQVCEHLYSLIDCELEYEHLHLAEYFFSGCLDGEFTEFQSRISFFSYLVVKKVELNRSLDRKCANLLYKQICHYLPSAIYRIKNNINLSDSDAFSQSDQADHWLVALSKKWLPEPFRREEFNQISQIIEAALAQSAAPKLSLTSLLNTIEQHSVEVNKQALLQALGERFAPFIDDDLNHNIDSKVKIKSRVLHVKKLNSGMLMTEVMAMMEVSESEKEQHHYLIQRINDLSVYSKITEDCSLFCLHSTKAGLYLVQNHHDGKLYNYFFYASQDNTIPMSVMKFITNMISPVTLDSRLRDTSQS